MLPFLREMHILAHCASEIFSIKIVIVKCSLFVFYVRQECFECSPILLEGTSAQCRGMCLQSHPEDLNSVFRPVVYFIKALKLNVPCAY